MADIDRRSFRSFTYRKCRAEWDAEKGLWVTADPNGHHLISSSDKDGIKSYLDDYLEAYYELV